MLWSACNSAKYYIPLLILLGCTSCSSDSAHDSIALSVIGNKNSVVIPATAQGLVAFDADGQIEPALAERWIVSDDGLSLVFRIARANWSKHHPVTAGDVAASLKLSLITVGKGRLGPLFSAVSSVIAMTDHVVEIKLRSPRPHFLQLLAQPEFAIRRNGISTGPYQYEKSANGRALLTLNAQWREANDADNNSELPTKFEIRDEPAAAAITNYIKGKSAAVFGGNFDNFPLVSAAQLRNSQIIIDPTRGLFGLVFTGNSPVIADADMRAALSMAIDRNALMRAIGLPQTAATETILPQQFDSATPPITAFWSAYSLQARVAEAAARVQAYKKLHTGDVHVRVALPEGPGGKLLFVRLVTDWQAIGVIAVAAKPHTAADLQLIDEVAPIESVNWYFSRLHCTGGSICDPQTDLDIKAARAQTTLSARAQYYAQVDHDMTVTIPYIPLAAPLRWSLTTASLPGLRPSPFGYHPLIRLKAL